MYGRGRRDKSNSVTDEELRSLPQQRQDPVLWRTITGPTSEHLDLPRIAVRSFVDQLMPLIAYPPYCHGHQHHPIAPTVDSPL
jgi:hypothetical protein